MSKVYERFIGKSHGDTRRRLHVESSVYHDSGAAYVELAGRYVYISAEDSRRAGEALIAIADAAQPPAGDPVGSIVYVVGEGGNGRIRHYLPIGTEVEVLEDAEVTTTGSYYVRATSEVTRTDSGRIGRHEQYVSPIDLDVEPPVVEFKTGDVLRRKYGPTRDRGLTYTVQAERLVRHNPLDHTVRRSAIRRSDATSRLFEKVA